MMRRTHAPPIEDVGDVTARLAVLLAAGVTPAAAWRYLLPGPAADADQRTDAAGAPIAPQTNTAHRARSAAAPGAHIIASAVRAADQGDSVSAAVARSAADEEPALRSAWCGLAAAWFVATESGAPLAQCLRQLASAFEALGQTQRDLQVALAGPAATARLVMALPVVGVLFGLGLGFNTLQTLFWTAPGLACLTVGVLLMVVGALWNRRMIRRATPTDVSPGLTIDLTAMAMAGGGSIDRARRLVAEAATRYDIHDAHDRVIESVVDLSNRAGVPAAELLRSEADRARREARTAGQQAAATLAVRLMLPLGVCVLPAFMLLGVAPLLLAIISSTVASI
ncbi:MAG TPA: type II secretion system F family protein [Microbacteriaceae bacterium]